MAKPIIRTEYREIDGKWYKVDIRCDNTEGEPEEVPCNCGDTGTGTPPTIPPVPDENQCEIATNMAVFAFNIGNTVFGATTAVGGGGWANNLVAAMAIASAFPNWDMGYQPFHVFLNAQRTEFLQMEFDGSPQNIQNMQQELVCVFYRALQFSGGQITPEWLQIVVDILKTEPTSGMGTAAGWQAYADLLAFISINSWQIYAGLLSDPEVDYEAIGIDVVFTGMCGECNDFGSVACEDVQIDGEFHNSGTDYGFDPYIGLCSQLPAEIFQNLTFANVIETHRTDRAFEGTFSCQVASEQCRAAGVVYAFSEPVSLCSMQMLAKIYIVPPPGETTHVSNSSRIGIFYKVAGNPAWQFLAGKLIPIHNGQPRQVRWAGIAKENVTQVLAVHWSGGSIAAIDRVAINLPDFIV